MKTAGVLLVIVVAFALAILILHWTNHDLIDFTYMPGFDYLMVCVIGSITASGWIVAYVVARKQKSGSGFLVETSYDKDKINRV